MKEKKLWAVAAIVVSVALIAIVAFTPSPSSARARYRLGGSSAWRKEETQ